MPQPSSMREIEELLRRWVVEARPPGMVPKDFPVMFGLHGLVDWAIWRSQERFRAQIHLRLRDSGVIERIALEGLPAERAIDHVPLALRWLFPRMTTAPAGLHAALRELTLNLDWYLQPPRPLVRWHWVAPLFGTGLIGLALVAMARSFSIDEPTWLGLLMLIITPLLIIVGIPYGVSLFVLPQDIQGVRERMMRGVFAEELLNRLGLLAGERTVLKPAWLKRREALPGDP